MNTKNGLVIWITGLSGTGKTTLGKMLYKKIKKQHHNTIFLDGDILRNILGFKNKSSYTKPKRKSLALSYAKLCCFLSEQGFNIVICTISLFNEVHKWNRIRMDKYYEIYLKRTYKLDSKKEKDLKYVKFDEPYLAEHTFTNILKNNSCKKTADIIYKFIKDKLI